MHYIRHSNPENLLYAAVLNPIFYLVLLSLVIFNLAKIVKKYNKKSNENIVYRTLLSIIQKNL